MRSVCEETGNTTSMIVFWWRGVIGVWASGISAADFGVRGDSILDLE